MPHQIFEIDELLGLVIDELVEISPQTAVSFALACRSFEEPALSSLWREKRSLTDLVKVLPNHTWVQDKYGNASTVSGCNFSAEHIRYKFPQAIEDDPSAEDWTRLRRYTSWMRELFISFEDNVTDDAISRLSSNSPDGMLCPKLERLDWEIDVSCGLLSFPHLILSPNLKRVDIHTFYYYSYGPRDHRHPPLVKEVISSLPSSLQDISLTCGPWEGEPLKDAMSSLVLRSGPPLRSFVSRTALSEAALYHLTRLPNLRSWTVIGEPPQNFSPATFPPLEKLCFKSGALPWLHLLVAVEERNPQNSPMPVTVTMNANIKETLKLLDCPKDIPVDPTLISSIPSFRNLVTLYVGDEVDHWSLRGRCVFGLSDDGVENLAVTLPSLVTLRLGNVCSFNSCRTTVSSLLSISIHCLRLTALETHFNTQTIIDDIQRLLNEGSGRGKPRCKLQNLCVGNSPLRVREDVGTIAMGLADIFPCLETFLGRGNERESWESVLSEVWRLHCRND